MYRPLLIVASLLLLIAPAAPCAAQDVDEETDADRARRTVADMRTIGLACAAFALDNGGYPDVSDIHQLRAIVEPVYIRELPLVDGWQREFVFKSSQEDGYVLQSFGRDGVADTAGPAGESDSLDADIIYANGEFKQWPSLAAE